MKNWLRKHPQVRTIRVAAADLNGQARGKRIPTRFADKVVEDGTRFPMSVLNLDIWGEDIDDSPLVFESGDADGILHPTERGFLPMPWLDAPSALLPIWMFHEDGRPYGGDPRHALRAVVDRYKSRGLTPVCAVELEFFLIDDSGRKLQVPCDDALRAADDAWLFKMLVKGLARRHGFAASFMAKPYEDYPGSGLHTHFSVLDKNGNNVFDDGGPQGTAIMRHAVAGCMNAMAGCALVFAPHANSFDRMVPGAHAPTGISWAYENRTSSIRIPSGSHKARRIEHRVSGGDVNPYLMLAAVLGAAMNGIEDGAEPPAPITGNAYAAELPQIPGDWKSAIDAFENSEEVKRIFAPEMVRNFILTKRQELHYMQELTPQEQVEIYLDTV